MVELERNTSFNPIVIMSATCGSLSQFFQPLIDQGLTGDGTHIIQYLKDANDAQFADDEIVKLFHEVATAQGLDSKQTTYSTGWIFAMFMEAILNEAATYEGGLDRGNIALAARQHHVPEPDRPRRHHDGDRRCVATPTSSRAARWREYTIDEAATDQLGSFVKAGELLDNNGGIGNYEDFQAG